jgi:heavy metal translocating P-type ATPase
MIRLGLSLFFSMNVMAFTMYLWTQDETLTAAEPGQRAAAVFYEVGRYVCLLFATPVLLLLGGPLVEDAVDECRRARPSLSGLLLAGVLAAFGYSAVSVFRGAGHVYFEVSCMVLVAVALGRWMEAEGKRRTTEALRDLRSLLPDAVRRIGEGGEVSTPRAEIRVGDRVRVLAGERIAVDGLIEQGVASVDEQAVTGESVPVGRHPGDSVRSGTLNLDGDLRIRVTAGVQEDTMQRIIDAVERALTRHDRYQRLADRISSWFLPAVFVVASVTLAAHWRAEGFASGLLAALAVVVIACPCALGLATPMALWSAVGQAARRQILLRDADCLDRLARVRLFGFDKTGTLTTGMPRVGSVVAFPGSQPDEVLAAAAAVSSGSTHPLSRAIVAEAHQRAIPFQPVREVRTVAGMGIRGFGIRGMETLVGGDGQPDGCDIQLGSPRWIGCDASQFEANAGPVAAVGWNGEPRGVIGFLETPRAGARECVAWLLEAGRRVEILTGDLATRAAVLAKDLGVPVHGELLPDGKCAWVESRRADGEVAMVGDGINDAPALAAASVGIALGSGADITRHTAAVCLLGDDLTRLPWLVRLAERTVRTIRWNLFWAFFYNTIGIGIAAAGWMNPILAAVAMAASSLIVVGNSLRLGYDSEPTSSP